LTWYTHRYFAASPWTSPKWMATSTSSLASGPSEANSRLRIPVMSSGLVANTRATDVASRLVRAMRWRSKDARIKLGLSLRGLFLTQELMNREMARRQRRNTRPQVNLGSENWVTPVFTEAVSTENVRFSSTTFSPERDRSALAEGMVFPASRVRGPRVLARGMGEMVDAGLSSLCTTDSMAVTCSSISSTRGKNESTTESSIP
jgi:hypothetical protein